VVLEVESSIHDWVTHQASHRGLPRDRWDDFDAQVRSLYDRMVAITVMPDWAKLIDFETSAPVAVERLVRERRPGAEG
jgi:hypothetical protein